jgi:hypothetical protein
MRSAGVLGTILTVIFIAEFYSYQVVRSALRTLPAGWRTGLTIAYIALTLLTWASFIFFRRIHWPNLHHMVRNIFIAFTIGFFVGKVFILLIMLLDDVRRLFMWIAHFFVSKDTPAGETINRGMSRSIFISRLALVIGGTWLFGFLYGITNRYRYQIRRVKLRFDELPEAFRGLKIIQVSDIHTGSFDNHEAVAAGMRRIMDEKADIIFFTGDLVNNRADEVDERYQKIYSTLKAPMGVYSILGNHDYGDYEQWPTQEAKKENLIHLTNIHAGLGWKLLRNENAVLQRGNDKIAVVGVENWSAKASFPKYGDLAVAHRGLENENIPFKILLSHDPSHWDAQVRPGYPDIQLTLSGHTHGMQMGVEIPGFKWSPVQYMYSKWAGLYQEGKQYLYVNRGYGFLAYPGRLGILPEITVIELV